MITATQRIFTAKLYKESILIRYIFRQCNQFCEFLANIDFPEITRRCWNWSAICTTIIATKSRWVHVPMIFANCKSRVYIQPFLIFTMTPFANFEHAISQSPILANSCQPWVVIFHSDIWATRDGLDIRLTAEVLDYSFTSVVSNSVHVERTSIVFTAVESQLGERQVCSQLIHGGFCENHLITGYSTVWSLDWKLRGWSWTNHNVGNEEPSSWNGKLFFNKEKQPFLKVQV